ncbi:cytoskeletal protein RodZ [Jannaschia seosinensis]|uniref:Cytoskeletal protein RodZ n=1 Tax=Jannaschia seosinensis TaxID=313367 RepID=A0A0M7BEM7_9RHOB|nr:RodZ domain-containing protein [Jannaschia seosinensis]CUH40294.1 cytoskeletal protein RodZ [Jannaschia seosinensis]
MGQRMFGRKSKFFSNAEAPARGYDSFELRLGDEMRGERATLGKSLMDVQRELRIKASYIAAIENADLSAFDSLSFVAGYVRSYARYLGMEPEIVFARFCEESGFGGFQALKPMDSEASRRKEIFAKAPAGQVGSAGLGGKGGTKRKAALSVIAPAASDPILGSGSPFSKRAQPVFAGFEPGALGSLAVLGLLVAGLGYGGWTIVQEVQRVNVAPVEQAPILAAELDPLATIEPDVDAPESADILAPSQDALARLYRPQALDAPILTARDAPISTISPGAIGALASVEPTGLAGPDAIAASIGASVNLALAEALGETTTPPAAATPANDTAPPATPRVLADEPDAVVLVAVRETWVRVRSADGDTLFEKILKPGETYEVPAAEVPASLRTGNSGALYMNVAGQTYGPVAPGAQVVSNVAMAADAVRDNFTVADLEADKELARVVAELTALEAPGGITPAD